MDIFDHLAVNFDSLADNLYHVADKNVRDKIPRWLNDMLYAKVFPQLFQGEFHQPKTRRCSVYMMYNYSKRPHEILEYYTKDAAKCNLKILKS